MISELLGKKKALEFERTYDVPIDAVWQAWTEADRLRDWWRPAKTEVAECEIDLRPGGRIYVVTVGGEAMGRYAGTRWPMEGIFSKVEAPRRLTYDARSWTEGAEATGTIHHTNDLTLTECGAETSLTLRVDITQIGSGLKSKLAVMGMKWGYKSQLDDLQKRLAASSEARHA